MEEPLTATAPLGQVLVTGGSGFIGRPLVAALEAAGAQVTNLDPVRGPGRWIPGDVRDLPAGLPPAEVVVHVAGLAGGGSPVEDDLFAVNAEGTRSVLAHAVATGARRVVVLSSIAVLGPSEVPLDESAPIRPSSAYGRSKAMAERDVAAAPDGLETVIVRPGYVFGRGNTGNFGRLLRAIAGGRFALPGRTDTIKAGIYLPDLIRLLCWLAATPDPPAVVNAVYPDTPTVLAWTRMLRHAVGQDGDPRVVPEPLVRLALGATDGAAALTGTSRLRTAAETVRKLRESSNVISREVPGPRFTYAHSWATALEELTGTPLGRPARGSAG